jgi:hypothetical protein
MLACLKSCHEHGAAHLGSCMFLVFVTTPRSLHAAQLRAPGQPYSFDPSDVAKAVSKLISRRYYWLTCGRLDVFVELVQKVACLHYV